MRYLVKARLKKGKQDELLKAIEDRTLGQGSVARDEYLCNMEAARVAEDGIAHWVEACFCPTTLAGGAALLGAVFRAARGPGCAQPEKLPRLERDGAVGLLRL